MKLREFHLLVSRLMEHPVNADSEVVILRSDPSIGPHASTGVRNIGAGFDWDNGKVLIFPEQLLHARNDAEQIKALTHQLDGTLWELNTAKRENRRMASKIRELIPLLDQSKVDDELLRKLQE